VSLVDSSIVKIEYDGQRNIRIRPVQEGKTRVRVDDLALKGSTPAYATVIVSGIASIELSEDSLILVETTASLSVNVLDREGYSFAPE
jgi:hypothetical protein